MFLVQNKKNIYSPFQFMFMFKYMVKVPLIPSQKKVPLIKFYLYTQTYNFFK